MKSRGCSSNYKWSCLVSQQFHYWPYIQRKWSQHAEEICELHVHRINFHTSQQWKCNGCKRASADEWTKGSGVPVQGMWIRDHIKWRKWAGHYSILHLSFLTVDATGPTDSGFPDTMDCTLELYAKINPCSVKLISSGCFIKATGKERRQDARVLLQVSPALFPGSGEKHACLPGVGGTGETFKTFIWTF